MECKPIFLFTGQGKQDPAFLNSLLKAYPFTKKWIEQQSIEIKNEFEKATLLSLKDASQNQFGQTLIGITAITLIQILNQKKITPQAVAGFSVGEWIALAAAKIINIQDLIMLLKRRGKLMSEASKTKQNQGMAALVGIEKTKGMNLINEFNIENLFIANQNASKEIVISGTLKAIEELNQKLLKEKIIFRLKKLNVEGAFHTPFMQDAEKKLQPLIEKISFSSPCCQFFSSVSGQEEKNPSRIKELIKKQMTAPVLWQPLLKPISACGNLAIEIGKGTVLQGLWRKEVKKYNAIGAENFLSGFVQKKLIEKDFSYTFEFQKKDPFYNSHFEGFPVVPGSLIIESFLQTIEKELDKIKAQTNNLIVKNFQFRNFIKPKKYTAKILKEKNQWHCKLFQDKKLMTKGLILSEEENDD